MQIEQWETPEKNLKRRLRFEEMLSDLSARLMATLFDQLDSEIHHALRQMLEFFQVGLCALLEVQEDRAFVRVTHAVYGEGVEPVSGEINIAELYPWTYGKLMRGEHINISRVEDYPEEALMDRQSYAALGTKSRLAIPVAVSGRISRIITIHQTRRHQTWPEEYIPRMRLMGEILVNALERRGNRLQLEEQLRFEMLLSEISGRFVNLPADRVDGEIKDAQRRVCECLGLDLSALWQWSMETPRILTMTHLYRPLGGPPLPEPMYAHEYFPWCQEQLEAGRIVVVSSMEELPAEAARDQEVWRHLGIKTTLTFPLSPGGGPSIGALSFNTMQQERYWPEPLIQRLKLVAQMFINALIRKYAETTLRESEARLSLTTDAVGAGLWIMEVDTKKVWVSPKSRELFHFAPDEEIHYESYFRVIHPEDRDRVHQDVQHALRSGENLHCDYRIVLPDGSIRWIGARGKRFLKSTGKPDRIMGLSLDITERKRAEEAIRESEAKYRSLYESMMDGYVLVDMDGRIMKCNESFQEMMGYTNDELLRLTYSDITPEKWHDFELKIVEEQVLTRGYSDVYEKEYRKKDGTAFPIELRTFLLKDETGNNIGMWAIVRDIIDRKLTEAEARKLRENLAHITRVSTIGGLTGALAHEINQPLAAILSNAQAAERFLEQDNPNMEEIAEILRDIVRDDNRAAEVIRKIRSLLKKEKTQYQPLSLNGIIEDILNIIRNDTALTAVSIEKEFDSSLPTIWGDQIQLQQVVLNLVLNAAEAMNEASPDLRRLIIRTLRHDDRFAEVSIRDCGPGIKDNPVGKLFEPFYTTKSDGMGMGLAISKEIVNSHKGLIWAVNNPDMGATFFFTLPFDSGVRQ